MEKHEFIEFLINKSKERDLISSHWVQTYTNSTKYWTLFKPFVDWLADDLELTEDGQVKITYDKSLYGNTSKIFQTSYEDFVKNYDKTVS